MSSPGPRPAPPPQIRHLGSAPAGWSDALDRPVTSARQGLHAAVDPPMDRTPSRHHNTVQDRTEPSPGDQSSASVGSGHQGSVFFPWGVCTWFVSHLLCSDFRLCPSCYMLLATLNSTWFLRPTSHSEQHPGMSYSPAQTNAHIPGTQTPQSHKHRARTKAGTIHRILPGH